MNQYAEAVGDLADMDPEVRGRYRDYLAAQFPERFFAEEEVDIAALKAWVAENLEYFRFEGNLFPVDEQLKALGVSNRTPAFLDLLEQRLAADPRDELALELCGRYLGRHAEDGAAALQWIRENRDRLYFTDVGGFRWFAAPEAVVGAAEAPAPPTQASGASEREPLRR